jgi:hypothetical protein
MLERISNDSQVNQNQNTNELRTQQDSATQTQEVVQSVARQTDMAFQASLARFRVEQSSNLPTVAQVPTTPPEIRQDVVDAVVESFENLSPTFYQGRLLYALQDKELNLSHEEQVAVIGGLTEHILDQDYADELLQQTFMNFDTADLRNVAYDNQKLIAGLIGDAYEAGYVTDAHLQQMASELGEEGTQQLVLNLASHPDNVLNGYSDRVVEALGEEADRLGYDTATALAFTSSDSLINEHYTTDQSQRDAFGLVRGYIEQFDDSNERGGFYTDYTGDSATLRADLSTAVLNASRLTANGNGYTQSEFDDLLRKLGPDLVNETIARAGKVTGDDYYNRALDALGDASTRIVSSADDDDKQKWQVNAAIAYTQSRSLIASNLTTPEARLETFDLLNQQLVGLRDDVDDAAGNYSLLKQPAILEGMTTLLERNGDEILTSKLNTAQDYEGQADLVQFFQSSLFSVNTSDTIRTRLENVISSFVDDQLNSPGPNSGLVGSDVGELLGTINVASARAIEAAPDENRSEIEGFTRSLASKTIGALGGKGLGLLIQGLGVATTGPAGIIATTIGGQIISKALDSLFGVNDKPPTRQQIEEAFLQAMQDAGIEVNLGEGALDGLDEVYNQTIAALEVEISQHPVTSERYRELDRQIAQLEQLRSTLDSGYLKTRTSDELQQELDRRE